MRVEASRFLNLDRVRLHLRYETPFGSRITFPPPLRWVRGFSPHPLAEQLRARIAGDAAEIPRPARGARARRGSRRSWAPIEEGWLVTGNVQGGDGGSANLAFRLSGPNDAASVTLRARKDAGQWRHEALVARVEGGPEIDLLAPAAESSRRRRAPSTSRSPLRHHAHGGTRMPNRIRSGLASQMALAAALGLAAAPAAHAADHPGKGPYEQYCASCHGVAADGKGPVAEEMKIVPSDLRKLHERYGDPLAKPRLREVVDGRDMPRSHGLPDMPVWGDKLLASVPPGVDGNEFFKRGTILVIIDYLQTLQQK